MPSTISILIVTHNRASILARTLESLKQIEIPSDAQIDLVVVANVCTDDTLAVVDRIAATMPFPTRCVEEKTIGVGPARNRALQESRGDIIIYVDDDVFVERGWLTGILDVFVSDSADIVAGKLVLCWDSVAKPAWMSSRSEHLLSCIDYGDRVVELTQGGQAVTANFAMRRAVINKIGDFSPRLGRCGNAVLAGEDTEFFARALRAGFRIFYGPKASALHWVAPHRVTTRYLGAAAYGNGLARPFLYPDFTAGFGLVLLLKHGFKFCFYSVFGIICRLLLGKKKYINNLIRARTSGGIVMGVLRRLSTRNQPPQSSPAAQVS